MKESMMGLDLGAPHSEVQPHSDGSVPTEDLEVVDRQTAQERADYQRLITGEFYAVPGAETDEYIKYLKQKYGPKNNHNSTEKI